MRRQLAGRVRNDCDVRGLRVEQFNVWRLHLMDDLILGVNTHPAVELSTQSLVKHNNMTQVNNYFTSKTYMGIRKVIPTYK